MKRIAIIGSGIAAASLAYALHDFADITVFEKARGVGGRLSTRYQDDFEFDLGAPYFSVTHPSFQGMIHDLMKQDMIASWRYREWHNDAIQLKNTFLGLPRMNELVKCLLKATKVCLAHKITKVAPELHAWRLSFESQAPQTFDWVISTAPPAQSQLMLPSDFEYHDLLADIELKPSFMLLLGLTHPLGLNWDCYDIKSDKILRCIINSNKPGREQATSLVIESQAAFAQQHLDDHDATILALLMADIRQFIPIHDSHIGYQQLHRWRYAQAIPNKSCAKVYFDSKLGLGVCGDWTESAGVEGAYLSGVRMAYTLRQMILGKTS